MLRLHRVVICGAILSTGLAAQGALQRLNATVRPPLLRPLASIPLDMENWVGKDDPVSDDIIERAQTTEYLNRTYESRKQPGLRLRLWINYSLYGNNLRHTPEICLPSTGWTKVESLTRELEIPVDGAPPVEVTRLGYSRGELVEHVGFWYYIFGEGHLEKCVRGLSITSRSSHGQTTRGSSMTVEVFYPGDNDADGDALREFARDLVHFLEPILPRECAVYHVP